MIDTRKLLSSFLLSLHPRVYFQAAPDTAVFPYLVYDIGNILCDGEGSEVFNLDIDGWDSNTTNDTLSIEMLMQKLKPLDKKTLINENIAVTFYLENKLPVPDNDKNIKRRKYIYQCKLIRRNE